MSQVFLDGLLPSRYSLQRALRSQFLLCIMLSLELLEGQREVLSLQLCAKLIWMIRDRVQRGEDHQAWVKIISYGGRLTILYSHSSPVLVFEASTTRRCWFREHFSLLLGYKCLFVFLVLSADDFWFMMRSLMCPCIYIVALGLWKGAVLCQWLTAWVQRLLAGVGFCPRSCISPAVGPLPQFLPGPKIYPSLCFSTESQVRQRSWKC